MIRIVPDAMRASLGKSEPALHRLVCRLNNGALPEPRLLELSVAGLRTFRGKLPSPKRLRDHELRDIHTPAYVVFCEHSPVNNAPRAAARAQTLMSGATVEIVPGAGHMLPVVHADLFAGRVLAFADRVRVLSVAVLSVATRPRYGSSRAVA